MRTWLPLAVIVLSASLLPLDSARADLDSKQLKLVRGAATSLRQAVLTVERETKGKAYWASSSVTEQGISFTVKVDAGDKVVIAQVDAKSGKMTESAPAPAESGAKMKDFAKVKGTLLAAMKAAEATAKGKSYQAAYKHVGNKDLFEIEVAGRDDVEKDVIVDAASGKIRKVSEKSAEANSPAAAGAATTTLAAH